MLHYFDTTRIAGHFRCDYCGEHFDPERIVYEGKWAYENFRDGPGYTVDETKWLASPESCKKLRPLDMTVFDRVPDSRMMGYRMTPEVMASLKIDDETLNQRFALYAPLLLREQGLMRFNPPGLRGIAYMWEPEITGGPVEVLEEILVTPSWHTCAYYGFFKPTLAEVYAQVPPEVEGKANAFYLGAHILISRDGEGHLAPCHWVRV